jgi:ubiquinone/menaquinone biosynthesis C-methylase UbiE
MSNAELAASYQRRFVADAYDALAAAVFAPVGGIAAIRNAALDHAGIVAGERVLELGCGSGGVTRLLCARGAQVTAVDWSEPMLRKAARRAPAATFERAEITAFAAPSLVDVVLFSFVLHELDEAARAQALAVAHGALRPGGRLAVVDHALPTRGVAARAMSRLVHGVEPETSRGPWLADGGAERELRAHGFAPGRRVALASGMAFALVALPA